jgi:hypothetical protein
MQYVRSISGSVSKTWNSINPATLSGAIDVIVIEQEDGAFATIRSAIIAEVLTVFLDRNPCMFAFPRPIRQVLFAPPV